MSRAYSDDEIRAKLSGLSVDMQSAFLRATDQLFNHESNVFLHLINESRHEIDISEPGAQSTLAGTLEERMANRRLAAMGYSKVQFNESQYQREAVENYLKAVGRQRSDPTTLFYTQNSRQCTPRPTTSYRMRLTDDQDNYSLPKRNAETPLPPLVAQAVHDEKKISKEKEEILERMKSQGEVAHYERERQKELMKEKLKEKNIRKKQKENQVTELINQTAGLDEIQARNKERQEQLIRERLDQRRRQREKTSDKLLKKSESDTKLNINTSDKNDHPSETKLSARTQRSPMRLSRDDLSGISQSNSFILEESVEITPRRRERKKQSKILIDPSEDLKTSSNI